MQAHKSAAVLWHTTIPWSGYTLNMTNVLGPFSTGVTSACQLGLKNALNLATFTENDTKSVIDQSGRNIRMHTHTEAEHGYVPIRNSNYLLVPSLYEIRT